MTTFNQLRVRLKTLLSVGQRKNADTAQDHQLHRNLLTKFVTKCITCQQFSEDRLDTVINPFSIAQEE